MKSIRLWFCSKGWHRYRLVKELGNNRYYECVHCKDRIFEPRGGGYSPLSWEWLQGRTNILGNEIKVKIVKCSNPNYWYNNLIGSIQVVDSNICGDYIKKYMMVYQDSELMYRCIDVSDVEVVD